ncbi:MAG: ribosome maturation factor RimM [Ruminococcus sp.]|nr:ribosome maturation factor RimM [Ruminococcus sp.]MCD7773915.1 ribosome maturation factor RimM [Ruminococcus sp.]
MEKFLEIGKIVSVHGLAGDVKVEAWCDSPEVLCRFKTLYFSKGERKVKVKKSRVQKNMAILKLEGFDSVEQAQTLRNKILYADRESMNLPEDTYFIADLIGMEVINFESGESYGKITDVTQTGANDVYHIKSAEGKMYYVPAIADVVKTTDIENGVMKITPLRGLFDED